MRSDYRRALAAQVAVMTLAAVLCAGPAVLGAGCVATTLQVPAGHPARVDAASAPHARPAAILEPDAPLYTPDAGEPDESAPHHDHGPRPAEAEEGAEGDQGHEHERGQP